MGNAFLASGTVGGAVYYTLETFFFKNEKFRNAFDSFICTDGMSCPDMPKMCWKEDVSKLVL